MSYAKKVLKLYFTSGTSDKEYHVVSENKGTGWVVYGMYGRRGSTLRMASKLSTPSTLSMAESTFHDLVEEKRKEGYTSNTSGTPHAGVTLASAVVTGSAPAPAPAAAPAKPAAALVGTSWLSTMSDEELEVMLEDSEYLLQAVPRVGRRILVEVVSPAGVRALDLATGAIVPLPAAVMAELGQFPDWVLDGFYDDSTSSLSILDGYCQTPGTALQSRPFKNRWQQLTALANKAKAKLKHVSLQPVFEASDEKFQAASWLAENGYKEVLLKAQSHSYQTGVTTRAKAAVFVSEI